MLVSFLSGEPAPSQREISPGQSVILKPGVECGHVGHVGHSEHVESAVSQAWTVVTCAAFSGTEEDHRALLLSGGHGRMLATHPFLERGFIPHDRALEGSDCKSCRLDTIPFLDGEFRKRRVKQGQVSRQGVEELGGWCHPVHGKAGDGLGFQPHVSEQVRGEGRALGPI